MDTLAIQLTPRADVGRWTAWAAGDGPRIEGHGATTEDAMADLANRLRTDRADANALRVRVVGERVEASWRA